MYLMILLALVIFYYVIGIIIVSFLDNDYEMGVLMALLIIISGYFLNWWYPKMVRSYDADDNDKNSYDSYIKNIIDKKNSGERIRFIDNSYLMIESKNIIKICNLFGLLLFIISLVLLLK
ncbi:hypothetical protein O8C79_03290 [Aliarcobacter butzleri]|uniref:hypothetical protein n=1 Tax=Aliarcobacter butzleri TaxID=28197 RepID=UPI00263E5CCA|nr:hypothetical protein [Aliarcobacter butzleri]MDN5104320.1 hypothetical protein [Aliarcobacter butzleri]